VDLRREIFLVDLHFVGVCPWKRENQGIVAVVLICILHGNLLVILWQSISVISSLFLSLLHAMLSPDERSNQLGNHCFQDTHMKP